MIVHEESGYPHAALSASLTIVDGIEMLGEAWVPGGSRRFHIGSPSFKTARHRQCVAGITFLIELACSRAETVEPFDQLPPRGSEANQLRLLVMKLTTDLDEPAIRHLTDHSMNRLPCHLAGASELGNRGRFRPRGTTPS